MTKPKILFVDDDLRILRSISLYFSGDYDIVVAESGRKALEALDCNEIELIVSDYDMIDGSGLDFKQQLNEKQSSLPFILMSGKLDKKSVLEFSNLKVSHIFEKPFDYESLKTQIEKSLKAKRTEEEKEKLSFIGKNTGRIIHDINNNLGIIMMSSDVGLNLFGDNEKVIKLLNKAKNACSNIVDVVSKYKKLANEKDISFKTTCVEVFVKTLTQDLMDYCEANKLQVSVDKDVFDYSAVDVDLVLIRQAFLNLYSNAKDAMGSIGKNKLQVHFKKGNGYVQVLIKDEGPGIDESVKDKMFEEQITTKGENGTGMGLKYCKFIFDVHFGSIKVVETTKQGTTFMVQIPFSQGESK